LFCQRHGIPADPFYLNVLVVTPARDDLGLIAKSVPLTKVRVARTAFDAGACIARSTPDVVVVDLEIGLAALGEIVLPPGCRVIKLRPDEPLRRERIAKQ
jgi:hypothetical protein